MPAHSFVLRTVLASVASTNSPRKFPKSVSCSFTVWLKMASLLGQAFDKLALRASRTVANGIVVACGRNQGHIQTARYWRVVNSPNLAASFLPGGISERRGLQATPGQENVTLRGVQRFKTGEGGVDSKDQAAGECDRML